MFFNEEGHLDDEEDGGQSDSDEEEEGQFLAQSSGQQRQMTMEDIASYKEMMMAHMNAAKVDGKQNQQYYDYNEEEEEY